MALDFALAAVSVPVTASLMLAVWALACLAALFVAMGFVANVFFHVVSGAYHPATEEDH